MFYGREVERAQVAALLAAAWASRSGVLILRGSPGWRWSSSRRAVGVAARRRRPAAAQPPADAQGRAAVPRARAPAPRLHAAGALPRGDGGQRAARAGAASVGDGGHQRGGAGAAENAGLVSVRGRRVEVRHPLVRSAIVQGLSSGERRAAHLALADVLDDDVGSDQRAWHLAAAANGPDADVAAELELAAERARLRSGHAAAAAALGARGRAERRHRVEGRRLVGAAAAAWHAGQAAAPRRCWIEPPTRLGPRGCEPTSSTSGARSSCAAACSSTPATSSWPEPRRSRPLDTRKALEMLLQAREAAGWAGDTPRTVESGHRAAELPRGDDPESRFLADLLVGVGSLYEGKTAIGMPLVQEVVAHADEFDEPSWVVWAATGAQAIGDEARAEALQRRAIALARASGAVDKLTYVLLAYVLMGLLGGRFDVAAEAAEGLTLAREAGLPNAASTHLAMLAWFAAQLGKEDECRASAAAATERRSRSGGGFANAIAEWGVGILELSAARGTRPPTGCWPSARPGPERGTRTSRSCPPRISSRRACSPAGRTAPGGSRDVRAFAQPGAPDVGAGAGRPVPRAARRDPARGFAEALLLHADSDRPFDRARTQLLLGEHLGGRGRRDAAREHLRAAADGVRGDRRRVLGRARPRRAARGGETAEAPDPSALSQLTPQELQIARLVAEGHSNREVAARLFLSPRTIDAQLREVFAKAGISSRFELARLGLGAESPSGVLRSRLARAGLAELFRDLRTMRGEALQDGARADARRSGAHRGAPLRRARRLRRRGRQPGRPAGRRAAAGGRRDRARRPRGGGARLRRVARRRPGAGRGGLLRGHDRAGERAAPRRVAGTGSPSSRPHGSASSPRATPSGGGSSATCTTARSSGWWRWPCSCGSSGPTSVATPRRRRR